MKVVVDIVEERHELLDAKVLRPRKSTAWVECSPDDDAKVIAGGVQNAVTELQRYFYNCKLVAIRKELHCVAFVEIGPVHFEELGALFSAIRTDVSCPLELGFRTSAIGAENKNRMVTIVYALQHKYDPARIREAPPRSHHLHSFDSPSFA